MEIGEALLTWFLEDYGFAAISRQKLYQQFLFFCATQKYKNQEIVGFSRRRNLKVAFHGCCTSLIKSKSVVGHRQTESGFSFFTNQRKKITAEELICAIYPYGYISYLSAMVAYGLSRKPASTDIHFTAVERKQWTAKAQKDFPQIEGYVKEKYMNGSEYRSIVPTYPVEGEYLEKSLVVFTTKSFLEPELLDRKRVQNVFDLFIDMTRKPQYCGGFEHVFDVYNSYVDRYLDGLITRVNAVGTDMDKSRIGFILNKMLLIKHPKLEIWKEELKDKRGGSRKLISYLTFDSVFDSDWNISLNHESAKNPPEKRRVYLGRINLGSFGVPIIHQT